jgi:hypothetical protein
MAVVRGRKKRSIEKRGLCRQMGGRRCVRPCRRETARFLRKGCQRAVGRIFVGRARKAIPLDKIAFVFLV